MRVIQRHIEPLLRELLRDEPVIVLDGPRTAGKSFVVRQVVSNTAAKFLDLDEPAALAAVRTDPAGALRSESLVVVDEFQRASEDVLGAIKARLNVEGAAPGLYLLTGSTRVDLLPELADYLTGRHHRVTLLPLSQAEIESRSPKLLRRLLQDPASLERLPSSTATSSDYFECAVAGGFPLALGRTPGTARRRWFGSYIDDVVNRASDEENLRKRLATGAPGQDAPPPTTAALREVFRSAASTTAQLVNAARIQRLCQTHLGAAPDEKTVRDWLRILEEVHLIYRLEAWGTTLKTRINKHPKLHVVDSGLAAHMLGLTTANLSQPTKMTESGHLLETFVVMELLKERALLDDPVEIGHFRTSDDQEVDLVVETEDGSVFGVEVKRASRLGSKDLAGFRFLSKKLGTRFAGGLILHPGPSTLRTSVPKVVSAPISSLWAP